MNEVNRNILKTPVECWNSAFAKMTADIQFTSATALIRA